MSQSTTTERTAGRSLSDILGVVVDGQTYRNLLYLLLAFPLGLVYYVFLVTGFALGLALSVLLVGLGILLGVAIAVRSLAAFERRLANSLLGTDIPAPDDVETEGKGFVGTGKAYLQAASTWRGLGFVFLKFWLGIASFVLLLTFLGTALELLLLPLYPGGALNVQINNWEVAQTFQTSTQRLLAVPVGAALALLALHVLNAFASASASVATSLLGQTDSS
jgi:hypothetical protein